MTLAEFKAWLSGFSEAIGDAPTPAQWQRIQAMLATVGVSAAAVVSPTFYPSLRGGQISPTIGAPPTIWAAGQNNVAEDIAAWRAGAKARGQTLTA